MTAVGVRLSDAPGAPSRGDVRIRIPSGQPRTMRWLVALGDIHLSGDIRSSRLAHRQGRILAAGGGTQAGTGDGGLHNDRPGRSGQQRNSRGAEQEPVAGW